VVAATQLIVPILVDCSERGQNEELQKKYNVQGYPTVLYVDPQGEKIREMGSRDAGPIVKEIEGLAKKHPGRPSIWQNSLKGALAAGQKAKKPVAVYVAEESADLVKLTQRLAKDFGDRTKKFLFVLEIGRADALKARELESAPAAFVYDPASEEPVEKIAIGKDDKADVLNKALDEAAKKVKK